MRHKPSSPTEARVWHLSHGRLLSVVSVTLLLTCATPAQAATKIKSCPFVIRTPGVYTVTQDLTCSGTAITILADKVDSTRPATPSLETAPGTVSSFKADGT